MFKLKLSDWAGNNLRDRDNPQLTWLPAFNKTYAKLGGSTLAKVWVCLNDRSKVRATPFREVAVIYQLHKLRSDGVFFYFNNK